MNTFAAVRLIAARELSVKLRDKTFLFSTLFFLVLVIGGTVLPAIFSGGPTSVAASDQSAAAKLSAAGLDVRAVSDDAAGEQLVRSGDVEAAVTSDGRVLAMDDAPQDVLNALSQLPEVVLLDPAAVSETAALLVPMSFAMVFFLTSLIFGLQIAQSVTEEKQTRVVEILVASVPVRALLAGKVIAGGLLALGQIGLIALAAVVSSQVIDGGSALMTLLAPAIGWFIPFFVVGFVMLAALWAGVGALVNRQEDINGASMPVQLIVMAPFFAVAFLSDNATAMKVLSYVPLSAPTAMPVRLFQGEAAGWEPMVSLAILAVSAVLLLGVGARLYEGSLLRTNGRTSFAAAWRDRETRRLAELGND